MTTPPRLETERLILRGFEPERDFAPFCEMMADEETAKHIGGVMEPAVVWRMMASIIGHWSIRGYGFFVLEEKETGDDRHAMSGDDEQVGVVFIGNGRILDCSPRYPCFARR